MKGSREEKRKGLKAELKIKRDERIKKSGGKNSRLNPRM